MATPESKKPSRWRLVRFFKSRGISEPDSNRAATFVAHVLSMVSFIVFLMNREKDKKAERRTRK